MPFAIELLFDAKTDGRIRFFGSRLQRQGIPTIFAYPGGEPHVALAVFETCDLARVKRSIKNLAGKFSKFEARLSSVGSFPGKEGVLFLAPTANPVLLRLNVLTHEMLKKWTGQVWEYYKPGWWVPHCTLSMNLKKAQFAQGLEAIKKMDFGTVGQFNRLVLVEISGANPPKARPLFTAPLSGKASIPLKG